MAREIGRAEAVIVLRIHEFNDITLAALYNAVSGFGRIPEQNIAYQKALKIGLITADGKPVEREQLERACESEINRRIEAGTLK